MREIPNVSSQVVRRMLSKVPEVVVFFWVIKVLCTTVGETAADFLNVNLNLGLTGTSLVMGLLLLVALFFQFKAEKYIPSTYWITVVLISVFGTLVTDNLTDSLGVPLEVSTIVFSILLILTFAFWYAKEKTLSVHSIFTPRREFFYWLTILWTFALGTASGDLLAEGFGLGYLNTGIIVCVVIAGITLAWRLGLNAIVAFWLLYILTRPLGASLGDFLSQPAKYGGLGWGTTITSVVFLLAILGVVMFLSATKEDVITEETVRKEGKKMQSGILWQMVLAMTLLILVGLGGYYYKQTMSQPKVKNTVSQTMQKTGSSKETKKVDTPNPNTQTSSPLGDVTSFKNITQDSLDLVVANNPAGAKERIADLEFEWDNAQAKLKPMDGAKWTEVDDAIDAVLRQLRAVNPNKETSTSSLEVLLKTLE